MVERDRVEDTKLPVRGSSKKDVATTLSHKISGKLMLSSPSSRDGHAFISPVHRDEGEELCHPTEDTGMELGGKDSDGHDRYEFTWNFRKCHGSTVHRLVLEGGVDELDKYVELRPEAATEVCTYRTKFKEKLQEGTAQPIHLAASRGLVDQVRILIEYGASVRAMVTRDGVGHYDVLNAAVFAEGHGGSSEMVTLLLEEKAEMVANLDNKTPLHMAFQVGSVHLIELLYSYSKHGRGGSMLFQGESSHPGMMSPLEFGIENGRMTQHQLAMAAPAVPSSLRTFINRDPGCIPVFLRRTEVAGVRHARALANVVSVSEICKILRCDRAAAGAVLDACTDAPKVIRPAFHPLPMRLRMRLDKGMWFGKILEYFNEITTMAFYEACTDWKYDSRTWTAPAWHTQLELKKKDRARSEDVDIKVCHVPDLICAEFFDALVNSNEDECEWEIYGNPVVKGAIHHAWWHGAYHVNFVSVFISVWNLFLLVCEHWIPGRTIMCSTNPNEVLDMTIARQFVCARALVDLQSEFLQFMGYWAIGRPTDYLTIQNLLDILRTGVPALFLVQVWSDFELRMIEVAIVIIAWFRLLGAFGSLERVATVVLPLTRLVFALWPALTVTGIAFLAFFHALIVFTDSDEPNSHILYQATELLITASLPGLDTVPTDDDGQILDRTTFQLLFHFSAVCVFTVLFLNIFIAITGEQYALEKARSEETFLRFRADEILAYLLRMRVLRLAGSFPFLWSFLSVIALGFGLIMSANYSHNRIPMCNDYRCPHGVVIFWASLTVITISSYHSRPRPWSAQPLCSSLAKTSKQGVDSFGIMKTVDSDTSDIDTWKVTGETPRNELDDFAKNSAALSVSSFTTEKHYHLWIVRRASDVEKEAARKEAAEAEARQTSSVRTRIGKTGSEVRSPAVSPNMRLATSSASGASAFSQRSASNMSGESSQQMRQRHIGFNEQQKLRGMVREELTEALRASPGQEPLAQEPLASLSRFDTSAGEARF